MDRFVSLNFEIRETADARTAAFSSASFYGKGIFTTIAVIDGEPFLWDKHWSRLRGNAQKIGIDLERIQENKVRSALSEIVLKNTRHRGNARITVIDESIGGPWQQGEAARLSVLIATGKSRQASKDFRLSVSPYFINTTSPLAGIKSCNYLEPLMAYDEARARGFDEAIRINERGEAASGCLANIFWSKDGCLFSPSLKTGCLAGMTREYVIENLDCEEVEAGIDAIREADAIFLTSAGIGVVQVSEFEGRKLEKRHHRILELVPGPV